MFSALLGAEALIALAIAAHGGAGTPAMALLCWPVAGVAARFPNRASRIGTAFALVLAAAMVLIDDGDVLTTDPLALSLLLVAIAAVHTVSTVLRDSDLEYRGAAILDPLTGMLNRTALVNRTAEIEFQSRLTGEPVAVILLDLDRFKLVNDTRGHATGDTVLREVAYRLRKQLRAYDLVYRLGGEEFVVLLLGGTPTATSVTAEQLRACVAADPIVGLDLSVSIGVASSTPGTPFVWDDVFNRADAALYRAKADGRDRVTVRASSSQPHGAELRARVDRDHAQRRVAGVEEAVRHLGWDDDDLAGAHHPLLVTGGERRRALLDEEELVVGVRMQAWPAAGRRVDEDQRDGDAVVVDALELAGDPAEGKLILADDEHVAHAPTSQPSLLHRVGDRLEAVAGAELGDRRAEVVAHGPLGEVQRRRDVGRRVVALAASAPRARARSAGSRPR